MFGLFRKSANTDLGGIGDLLFGDVDLSAWKAPELRSATAEPWSSFEAVRSAVASGNSIGAVELLHGIAATQDIESRHYLQAWHFLRQLGVQPSADAAKRVSAVVLEVSLPSGLDTLAAYADHRARYINHGGKVIVWETSSEESMNGLVDKVIAAGQRVAEVIGPWTGPRRGPPPPGHVRVNMLTAAGLHFGEGPLDALSSDAMAGPIILSGTRLMQELIRRVDATKA